MKYEQVLAANADGAYSVPFEPDINVIIQQRPESIRFYAQLANLPAKNIESYLLQVLAGNLFGKETGGAILGLDRTGKQVVLLDFLSLTQDYRSFYERLEDFVNYVESWSRETRNFTNQAEREA